ncbi:hypothetical protein GJ496_005474 [Pomphorhynchus laevis]|nr:hypothetical protein GJ496_005474 [Pomphorhynchus laevis]
MSEQDEWCLIESDPWIFTDLLKKIGVKGVQMTEICSLEDIDQLNSIYGLLFLFKCKNISSSPDFANGGTFIEDKQICDIYFAKQVIPNACATQAIINMLLNLKDVNDLELGDVLSNFQEFTAMMDSETKGHAIGNCLSIKEAHNSFSKPNLVSLEGESNKGTDAFHYVAFVPISGRLVELDGLKNYPIDHGSLSFNWIKTASNVLKNRMPESETGDFNLLAMTFDRKKAYTEELTKLQAHLSESVADPAELQRISELEQLLADEEKQQLRYEVDGIRRNHNWTPFIVETMKLLAKYGGLSKLMEDQLRHVAAQTNDTEKASINSDKTDLN